MAKTIDGEAFRKMIMEGARAIESKKLEANEMNVFPVPDGDTGTNMSLTMAAAYKAMASLSMPTAGQAAERAATALLRGARGNSGVILSLLFRGFARRLSGFSVCAASDLAEALSEGVSAAYSAVMKPTEGTILTVSRLAAAAAVNAAGAGADVEETLTAAVTAGREALAKTPDQNPVLKKAGVVDAGGFGFLVIFEGMLDSLSGRSANPDRPLSADSGDTQTGFSGAEFSSEEIKFTYCTEFIVRKEGARRSINRLRAFLQNIGDSAVVVEDDEIVKVHVHTNQPDRVLGEGLKFGSFLSVKIENMREQHTELLSAEELAPPKAAPPEKPFGFVAVSAGDGISSVFKDLGVDRVVSGGQTMNPSTEDILAAVEQTPAETVFVLPNNKNIIMAAQQASRLCSDRQLIVVPSKTIPQGISALMCFDPSLSAEENRSAMEGALSAAATGQLTYAVRDSDFDGKLIKSGDYIGLLEGRLFCHGKNKASVLKKLAYGLTRRHNSFITVFYGAGVPPEEAEKVRILFSQTAPDAEINVIDGGQPVYYYIISAE